MKVKNGLPGMLKYDLLEDITQKSDVYTSYM